ncbi:MAG: F0F1 ATP synthase subunit B [Leptolyngbya sp. DLM2.Bin15]|nr:MAG: F0F1 ATP synthase subunit B [Leptolyngbya sp. DLM2.Bin15]
MGTLYWLAERTGTVVLKAPEIEEAGFGINLDLLDTNLINLIIIIGVLIYFGRGFLGKTLSERRSRIESEIREAEERKKSAASALAEQQQKLAQAKAEAAKMLSAAETSAQAARESILAEAEQDVARLREAAAQDLTSQQERIIREVRNQVVLMAMQQAETQLRHEMDDAKQQELVDRSIAMLGGKS